MVIVENVTVSYGGWDLFKNITFTINDNDRIGLVGNNGAGKTTLLKLIIGEHIPTSGSISTGGGSKIGYLPQHMMIKDGNSVYEETEEAFDDVLKLEKEIKEVTHQLEIRTDHESKEYSAIIEKYNNLNDRYQILDGSNRVSQIEKTLLGLGFKREDFNRQTSEFSSGWRMRIELAKILLKSPSVMLLDEPTNHLDIESIQWLEDYLSHYKGALLLISHDRRFLDNVTNRTVEIILGEFHDYNVPYSKYVVLRKDRMAQQRSAYDNQQKKIKKTEDFIERFRYKATKSNQVQSRIKQLDKIDVIEVEEDDANSINIRFADAPRSGNIILEAKDLSKSFDDNYIFGSCNMTIERGEKIAFVGRNGEGKTTMARIIVGEIAQTSGSLKLGHNLNIGYYAQNQEALIDGEITVYETLDRVAVGDVRTRLRDILASFLFRGEDIDKKVKVLSGGERFRLAMAKMMLEPHNVLILDEPTNHIDMRSKDILKEAIRNFDGTVILVSHDREFLDGLVEVVYEFRDNVVRQHLGGIAEFLHKHKMEMLDELNIKAPKEHSEQNLKTKDSKLSYLENKEVEKQHRKITNDLKKVEAKIDKQEKAIKKMDEMLANPQENNIDINDPAIFQKYEQLKKELDTLLELWEEKSLQIDEFNK
ncbi:MAG: ABC-F family ATP-binding cassette domain-containing protein [Bacteroidetes bacterium]|nr:ABC-F family ATP-binding cassette domain-containing protein [Bacteroidota bacterium]